MILEYAIKRNETKILDHALSEQETVEWIARPGVGFCDREDVSFMLPFGRVVLDNEVYWIYQISSWRNEFYSVARVRPEEVRPVVAVAGGECPKDAIR